MNRLPGKIRFVTSTKDLSLVEVDVLGTLISAIVLDTPESSRYLSENENIFVLFKETEVALAHEPLCSISIRNQLKSTVEKIEMGELLMHIGLDFKGIKIQALITSRSGQEMNLMVGTPVIALIKSMEISLEWGYGS
jgi:molybdate transport system regulatory protein